MALTTCSSYTYVISQKSIGACMQHLYPQFSLDADCLFLRGLERRNNIPREQ